MLRSQGQRLSVRRGVALSVALWLGLILLGPGNVVAAGYMDGEALGDCLHEMAESYPDLVHLQIAARSLENRPVWLVELGRGGADERSVRPAMLVVAGIEGNDLTGSAVATSWIEHLVAQYERDDETRTLLNSITIYVFPRLNPDAAESFFAKPISENSVSTRPVDDDHDGISDEDGPEDLNGDGRITWMRIEDPEGEYILDPAESRLLVKADKSKGEVGAYRLLTEGTDNDGDENWNEDGPGGVNFNRNFPFNYQWFSPWAGVHQVSEIETRALADFVVAHPNIGIVFTFGAADNLVQTPKGAPRPARRKPATAINENDLPYHHHLGEMYRDTLGLGKELETISEPGTFSDWMYFHRGRFSLAAQAWSPAMQLEIGEAKGKKQEDKDAELNPGNASGDEKGSTPRHPVPEDRDREPEEADSDKKEDSDKRNEEDRAFLKWVDEHAPDRFVPWQEFDHPDFPGQRVEIGGFAPFARTAPPQPILEEIAGKHAGFLKALARKLPRIGIRKMKSKHLGESVYDVEIEVENMGYLPTALTHGEVTRDVHPTRVMLDLDDEAIVSGTRITFLPTIAGSGGVANAGYVLFVPDRKQISVKVVSMLGGTVEATLELEQGEER